MYKFYEKIMSIILNIITFGSYYSFHTNFQHEMTKMFSNKTKHVTFKEAKKWVDEHIDDIKCDKIFTQFGIKAYISGREAFYYYDDTSEYFAGIIRFDGIGYLFNSWGLFQMKHYMNKILK